MNEAASGGVTVIRHFSRSRGFVSNMPLLFLLFLLFHFRVRGEHTVFIWLGNHKQTPIVFSAVTQSYDDASAVLLDRILMNFVFRK